MKDIILFIGFPAKDVEAIRLYEKEYKRSFRIALLYDARKVKKEDVPPEYDILISCNFENRASITKALKPYRNELLAATAVGDKSIPFLEKVVPHIPYLHTPTSESLDWATSKVLMRKRFEEYDKTITPAFAIVKNATKKTLDEVEKKVGFPLVVKPTGLGASLLVNICYHREELEKVLTRTLRKIASFHKADGGRGEPIIFVEQFMEGTMYSIDGYVDSHGSIDFCPMVHVKTGRAIGFDDFFGYQQMTPTLLKKESIDKAHDISIKAVQALGLRNTTIHIELIKTAEGWKVVEIGPRKGGFRHQMYMHSFGINHTMNDVLIRIPEKPIVPKKRKGYAVAMKFFAKKEGRLAKLTGIKKIQELRSLKHLKVNKKIGDMCTYAKHGGRSVFNVIMFNEERAKLLADIRRLEQTIHIETE
jgi:biotin carboxylase